MSLVHRDPLSTSEQEKQPQHLASDVKLPSHGAHFISQLVSKSLVAGVLGPSHYLYTMIGGVCQGHLEVEQDVTIKKCSIICG